MDLSNEKLIDIAQFAISLLDGAWFMAVAKEIGVDTAWKMDIAAWKQFSYVFGKRLKKLFHGCWQKGYFTGYSVLERGRY